jgi:predicted nuclease of predicted toxin-antitoxin system
VKFIVDAQLPRSLSTWLKMQGLDSMHTSDLPEGNRSNDLDIIHFADQHSRIVISKDSDFLDDHILRGSPKKLLVVKTGNIVNRDLLRLFELNIDKLKELFLQHDLIEINSHSLIVHE